MAVVTAPVLTAAVLTAVVLTAVVLTAAVLTAAVVTAAVVTSAAGPTACNLSFAIPQPPADCEKVQTMQCASKSARLVLLADPSARETGRGNNQGETAHGFDSHLRLAFRGRPQPGDAQGGDRRHGRHHHRMVRLLPLWNRRRIGFRQALFSELGSDDRHAVGFQHLLRRLCGAADRRCDLRPLRRSLWPAGTADH